MPKKTERLESYVEMARDLDRQARAVLVEVLQEEDAIGRAGRVNTDELVKKYSMNNGGN
ncbi:hypothetical protein JNB_04660 [Janibacter sp. HTCC2649]|uniref:hypothetical protein n=1 Tax=Janibacter sp. HTCC2649 TaxID=313589 RepID=UPI000066EC4B|nr:hypothetical protein [Janibacter sp. HTCC2649]EAP99434.1 hypothetical protein JNB_04660 [Janibacter sp. HTCC2649]